MDVWGGAVVTREQAAVEARKICARLTEISNEMRALEMKVGELSDEGSPTRRWSTAKAEALIGIVADVSWSARCVLESEFSR